MTDEKITAFAELVQKSAEYGTLQNLTFHSPFDSKNEKLKAKGTLKNLSGSKVLQIETFLTEGRVSQKNCTTDSVMNETENAFDIFSKADLVDRNAQVSLMISKKGKITLLKKGKIAEAEYSMSVTGEEGNDRRKKHLLTGNEGFLKELGVSDSNGRVHDKKQSKFRQICRFAEYIHEAEGKLKKDGILYVCDLCCGKSYLSFAAYHVLTEICGRQVRMSCVDLKQSVMDYCSGIARKCGLEGMDFICMNINDFVPAEHPDLVISLHACDIATDMVLDFASKYRADVILSTPCCHHEMNNNLNCPTLDFIGSRPILRQKLCDAATDALRLLKLESEGYKTDATELIDPEDTPKNVMLRAYRIKNYSPDSAVYKAKKEKYADTYRFLYGRNPL